MHLNDQPAADQPTVSVTRVLSDLAALGDHCPTDGYTGENAVAYARLETVSFAARQPVKPEHLAWVTWVVESVLDLDPGVTVRRTAAPGADPDDLTIVFQLPWGAAELIVRISAHADYAYPDLQMVFLVLEPESPRAVAASNSLHAYVRAQKRIADRLGRVRELERRHAPDAFIRAEVLRLGDAFRGVTN